MPPLNRRARGAANNIRVPINSLSGGVGRQAPSKRTMTEAQDIDNALVTLERSVEKRPGTALLQSLDAIGNPVANGELGLPLNRDLVYNWFEVSDSLRYLLVIDYQATSVTDELIYLFKYDGTSVSDVSPSIGISAETRAYITYNPGFALGRDVIRVTQVGPKLLILNNQVKAGYSSVYTGGIWSKLGLDGLPTGVEDVDGGEVSYLTASPVDPQGVAILYTTARTYASGTEVYNSQGVWKAQSEVAASDAHLPTTDNGGTPWVVGDVTSDTKWEYVRDTDVIPVDTAQYPDSSKRYLGQSLFDLSEVKLPPITGDSIASNGAEAMLASLYTNGDSLGRGKIFYMQNAYAGSLPGYYRVVSETDRPYLDRVRSPEAYSILDKDRMPHVLEFDLTASSWTLGSIDWSPRVAGNDTTNPGPQIFAEGNQTTINAVSFFRDRLWLAAEDSVLSSRAGDIEDFFLNDPSVIGDEDPIDVRLSTSKYTPVSYMTAFENYLFINTPSDVQFILQGSENLITPLTAEVSPVSFYSTASMIEPVLMGSQIYFFAPERMYLYMAAQQGQSMTSTVEVSQHCPDYLPSIYGDYAVVNAHDTIMVVDDETPTDVYCYTNRFSGNQVAQSSFFRYQLTANVRSIHSEDDLVFLVTETSGGIRMEIMKFYETNTQVPVLDSRMSTRWEDKTVTYDAVANTTTIVIPNLTDVNLDTAVFNIIDEDGEHDLAGEVLDITEILSDGSDLTITIQGDLNSRVQAASAPTATYQPSDLYLTIGRAFTMNVELSPLYSRDQANNVVDGVLSLRTLHTRHFNTGNYRVEVAPKGDVFSTSASFNAATMDGSVFNGAPITVRGETWAKVFGYSDEARIRIISDYPTPVNITNIELKGRFRQTFSSFIR